MDSTNQDYLGGLLTLANTFATPFAKKIAGDTTSTKDAQSVANANLQDTIANAKLNGSGPNDTDLARASAPTSLFDFINGKSAGATGTAGNPSSMLPYLLIGVGVLAVLYAMRR
jgi:hypothetical protein